MIQANAPEKSSKSIQVDPRAFDVDKSGHLSTEERGRFSTSFFGAFPLQKYTDLEWWNDECRGKNWPTVASSLSFC